MREIMVEHEFLEVETPMLQAIPGGATARPFATHHNALDMPMFLRIAPELYLKRLIVGGFERVFEINRNFRNEGVSPRHNPEFTMMEFYAAYTDYQWLMDFTETVIRRVAEVTTGSALLTYQERRLDLSRPFARLTICEAILAHAPHYQAEQLNDVAFLKAALIKLGVNLNAPNFVHAKLGAYNWRCLKKSLSTSSGNQLTSLTIPLKPHHWRANLIPALGSLSVLSCSSPAVNWPTASLN